MKVKIYLLRQRIEIPEDPDANSDEILCAFKELEDLNTEMRKRINKDIQELLFEDEEDLSKEDKEEIEDSYYSEEVELK